MKKLLTPAVVVLWACLWLPVGFANHPATNLFSATSNCEAPPPSDFHATEITTNSIKLKWTHNMANLYYFISGSDVTLGTSLTPVITQNMEYTFTGLTPGHEYTFQIGASYCPDGPPGAMAETLATTLTIVIDEIVYLNGCTPIIPTTIPPDRRVWVGVLASLKSLPLPNLNNCFEAQFIVDGDAFHFGMGYHSGLSKLYLNKLDFSSQNIWFTPVGDDQTAICKYRNSQNNIIDLFIVQALITNSNGTMAIATIDFNPNVEIREFKTCNNYYNGSGGMGFNIDQKGSPNELTDNWKRSRSSSQRLEKPSPNPFRESITVPYNLPEDGPVSISLYNSVGMLIRTVENNPKQAAGSYETMIDGAGLPTGQYFLRVVTANKSLVHAIVKTE
ncbi:MAG: fibronectin type III domain-containing protein [Lewinellaceae bacterium]|nr:fibronectin type III domain-containing protein [Saprospiraceae bacterium]MCB9331420.1 fibronectin type III domain-containing protein [Lewinellaceae bacterium]